MRTLIEIEENQIRELDRLAKKEKQSRAALIREAVGDYLRKKQGKTLEDGFGLWGDRKVDGLVYQEKIRSEW